MSLVNTQRTWETERHLFLNQLMFRAGVGWRGIFWEWALRCIDKWNESICSSGAALPPLLGAAESCQGELSAQQEPGLSQPSSSFCASTSPRVTLYRTVNPHYRACSLCSHAQSPSKTCLPKVVCPETPNWPVSFLPLSPDQNFQFPGPVLSASAQALFWGLH
jgi:hypothetical protein